MSGELGRWIAATLRIGTLAAVVVVLIGLTMALVVGEPAPGPRAVNELVLEGGGDALIGVGLLGLALLPLLVLVVAAAAFVRARERTATSVTLVVIGLLLASLVAAVVVGAAPPS